MRGNYRLQRWLIEHAHITTTEFAVALVLVWHRNEKTGLCCPGQAMVAREAKLTERGARKALASLERKGIITVRRKGRANRYFFNCPSALAFNADDETCFRELVS